jgi:hypothetical protein
VAVETGIPPQFLMEDDHMLRAIVAVLQDRAKRAKRQ